MDSDYRSRVKYPGSMLALTRSSGVVSTYGYDAASRVTSIIHQTPAGGSMGGVPAQLVPEPDPAALSEVPASCPASPTAAVTSYLQGRSPPDTGIKDCHAAEDYLSGRTAPVAAEGLASGASIALAYSYNRSGDVISASRADGDQPQTTTAYSYDTVHRLTASSSPKASNSYRYDGAGNRLSWVTDAAPDTGDALSVSAVFNLAGELVSETKARGTSTTGTSTTGTDYSYDGNGNRTRMRVDDAETDYRFDAGNNLTGISRSGMVTTSRVDGLGRELETSTTTKLGTTSGTQVWDELTVVQQAGPDGTRNLLRDVFGDVTLQTGVGGTGGDGAGPSWLLTDRQQSAIAQTAGARVSQLASYSDWGVQQFATTGWDAAVGYTGELSDPSTGVNRYFARGYTPTSGVWASADPHRGILTAPTTQNRYGYVGGNPATLTDSLGYGWMGYGSANHVFESSAGQHRTADGWERHLAANPDVRIKNPSTNTKAVPERHEDWWNPFSWSGDTWQNVGAIAAGIAVGVVIGVAVAACVAATAGLCAGVVAGVGVALAAAAVAGAAASVTTYALSTGEKTGEGYLWSVGGGAVLGGLTGGIGVAAGSVLRAGEMVATQQTVAAGIRTAGAAPAATSTATAAARFTVDAAGTAADSLDSVPNAISLGKFPEYLEVGSQTGAKTFNIPKEVWGAMTPEEQWARNAHFLDQAINNGSEIRLANNGFGAAVSGSYKRELEYLVGKGYTVSPDGMSMIRP